MTTPEPEDQSDPAPESDQASQTNEDQSATIGQDEDGWDVSAEEVTAAEVHPVTVDRVRAWLQQQGNRYFLRTDGQPVGIWNGSLFSFTLTDRVLQVRGQWHRTITIDRRTEFMTVINAQHSASAWPKCLLQVLDDGSMRLSAEVNTPITAGLSDQQLARTLRFGLGMNLRLFARFSEQFPDPLMKAGAA
ncbi:MAG TPA: YbjN domain-containing protein [Beutenbergiaceae bacterium]|nr:YbjN domain-containing protein [Beutenbergiaceae bacterium]